MKQIIHFRVKKKIIIVKNNCFELNFYFLKLFKISKKFEQYNINDKKKKYRNTILFFSIIDRVNVKIKIIRYYFTLAKYDIIFLFLHAT